MKTTTSWGATLCLALLLWSFFCYGAGLARAALTATAQPAKPAAVRAASRVVPAPKPTSRLAVKKSPATANPATPVGVVRKNTSLLIAGKSNSRAGVFAPGRNPAKALARGAGKQAPPSGVAQRATQKATAQKNAAAKVIRPAPQPLDWFRQGHALVQKQTTMTIYDINTGVSWKATYINGHNHADIIPASTADAKTIANNAITGNATRRPVIATIGGVPYAASVYAVAHGKTNYSSYFKGVLCIHFTGSKTHATGKVDAGHQNAIFTALRTKLP